jgi:hypothetical protein
MHGKAGLDFTRYQTVASTRHGCYDLDMLTDLPFWQKIWNRGIDITVGVLTSTISAAIIALIATLTWHWKRKRDLKHEADKQRQQFAIAEELDKQKRSEADAERIARLRQELQPLALQFPSAGTAGDAQLLQDAWDTWVAWLEKNELQYLPGNRKILDAWAPYKDKFRAANSNQTVALWAGNLTQQVRETQLSPVPPSL